MGLIFGNLIKTVLGVLTTLAPQITSVQQNGLSLLGTLSAPTYSQFLTNNPLPNGFPWGSRTASNASPYTDMPNTGVTRYFDFTASRGIIAPDGLQKSVILINGAFPGPTIEANWGDYIQITVHNNLTGPEEGVSFHWHGILQKENQWEDGVPSVQQCPIAPGRSYTYRFRADLYGTSWYHSHYSAQYAGGLVGPMIIHGPTHVPYDIDLGPVFINDYYHKDYYTIVKEVMGTDLSKIAPLSDNNLINGKGIYNCTLAPPGQKCTPNAGLSKFKFTPGMKHRLRLINSGAEAIQKFSIDGHDLTVIAVDFVPIKPYTTKIVTLGIGQRVDILVTGQNSWFSAVWMRSTISSCSLFTQPQALAAVYYPMANTNSVPTTTATIDSTDPCANDPISKVEPFYTIPVSTPATTVQVDINYMVNASGNFLFTMNGSPFRADYNAPILLRAHDGNASTTYQPEWNVHNMGSNSSYRFIIYNRTPIAHPMHLHGHNMQVLAEGLGTWDGTINRPSNPMRRDVHLLPPLAYMVWQVDSDNPGVWPFHCHIAWHVSAGLYINILERPDDVKKLNIPQKCYDTCQDWDNWTKTGDVNQIDSGL